MPDSAESERESGRNPIELKVEYKRLNAFFADYTRNISNGGTFIKTDKPLPIGTEFTFKLQVPKLREPLTIAGQVRWVVSPDDLSPDDLSPDGTGAKEEAGMGIRFVYADDDERQRVVGLIEELMVDSLGRLLASKLMEVGRLQDDGDEESV